MVTNVTSLLKTVKAVEDEATRGTRALEATIECIKQELAVRRLPTHAQHESNFNITAAHENGNRIQCHLSGYASDE